MRRGLLALLLLRAASAQTLLAPAAAAAALAQASHGPDERPIGCQVTPMKPVLTFGLRLQAGYAFRFFLSQYDDSAHTLTVVTTVAADGAAQPAYLLDRVRLPAGARTDSWGEAYGSYFLGEGHYRVDWLLYDDSGRACRKRWEVDAFLGRADRSLQLVMPPNTVTDLSLGAALGQHRAAVPGAKRLTILLDAAPIPPARRWTGAGDEGGRGLGRGGRGGGGGGRGPRPPPNRLPPDGFPDADSGANQLHTGDRSILLGALTAVLEQLPSSAVRLVVFNLEQQKVLYRADDFGLQSLHDVARTFNQLQLGAIDYRTLQNRTGHLDLLAEMINGELRAAPASDMVLFLGPRERFRDKMPDGLLDERRPTPPRFFFLACQRPGSILSGMADSVTFAVAKMKGKTIGIETPRQFSKAIQTVAR